MNIRELMGRVGCGKWPGRWESFYQEAMDYFDRCGNPYTDPAFYRGLNRRYGILSKHLDLYCAAAEAIDKREDLSRFFYLLCRALRDRDHHNADMREFSVPKSPGGQPDLAYDMLTALAVASEAPMCHSLLTARNLPEDHIRYVMQMPEAGVDRYMQRHNGQPGYDLLAWNQLAIDGRLFRAGRLEFELFHKFGGRARIFENDNGQRVALAQETKTENGILTVNEAARYWEGYPLDPLGQPQPAQVCLPKNQWKNILSRGDYTVSLHIPAGSGLTPEAVDTSLEEIRSFLQTYFPDYSYKAFDCFSWLMDPQLPSLLGADSNISRFCSRFSPVAAPGDGSGVFDFIFPGYSRENLAALPENTRLERALKSHYLSGNAIYETWGYFF